MDVALSYGAGAAMSDRLTDEDVAEVAAGRIRWLLARAMSLAVEVQEWRSGRPSAPTLHRFASALNAERALADQLAQALTAVVAPLNTHPGPDVVRALVHWRSVRAEAAAWDEIIEERAESDAEYGGTGGEQ